MRKNRLPILSLGVFVLTLLLAVSGSVVAAPVSKSSVGQVINEPAMAVMPDTDPAPPLTVLISANQKLSGSRYRVSGLIRNDSDQVYVGPTVVATFFTSQDRHYGPIQSDMQCPLLPPGETCPFIIEAISNDLARVKLHPQGEPTYRQTAPVTVSRYGSYRDAAGYVHLTGRVYNPNPVPLEYVVLNGILRDRKGTIVSTDNGVVIGPIPPNTSRYYNVAVKYVPYATTAVQAQGEVR